MTTDDKVPQNCINKYGPDSKMMHCLTVMPFICNNVGRFSTLDVRASQLRYGLFYKSENQKIRAHI